MGTTIQNVRGKNTLDDEKDLIIEWPQIHEYQENGHKVRVFKEAHLEGAGSDHVVKTRRRNKGKS